ncbi:MAG: hypothetical protein ACI8UO_004028 [Verrucomicrobiales bacterium]|jgi:hypothetical protein
MIGFPEKIKSRYRQFALGLAPLLPLIVITLISVYLLPVDGKDYEPPRAGGEFFPLSSFPMYSTIDPQTYMVYLTDAEGKPIGAQAVFGIRTSAIKKNYDKKLRRLEGKLGKKHWKMTPDEKAPAALETLEFIFREYGSKGEEASETASIALVDMRIYWRDGNLDRIRETVATLDRNSLTKTP